MPEMSFANIHEQFAVAFPELSDAYQRLCDDGVFSESGIPRQYPLIEEFFAVYIETLLLMNVSSVRNSALEKSFQFVEKMLVSPDNNVVGLVEIGIFEGKAAWWFRKAEPFVGPQWRAKVRGTGEEWTHAVTFLAPEPKAPSLTDNYGIRQAIAEQGKAEGLTLQDIPGVTELF